MQGAQQQAALTALSIALSHPALNTELSVLCAAARTCTNWRGAVQQCNACNTAVEVSLSASLSRLCSFARWLPKHSALVKSITISTPTSAPGSVDGLKWELHLEAAQQLLQYAMQPTEASPAAAATAAAAAGAAAGRHTAAAQLQRQQQQQQQQQLALLRSPVLSSVTMEGSTGMLAALPADSLTHLDPKALQDSVNSPAVSAALAGLSNLQQLRIVAIRKAPHSRLAGVAQLQQLQLTSLEVGGHRSTGSQQQVQQLLAQPLPVRVLRLTNSNWSLPPLDLSHLTELEELRCSSMHDAAFPSQLQQLVLCCVRSCVRSKKDTLPLQSVMQLQQLQRLTLDQIDDDHEEDVSCLAQLPALRQLALTYYSGYGSARAAPMWQLLPQLCELVVCSYDWAGRHDWEAICNGVAACTNLTQLDLQVWFADEDEDDGGEDGTFNAPCAKLAGLTNLKELSIWHGGELLAPGDALALTALTRLTSLVLHGAGAAVGDEAATALAGSCQQLRHLSLEKCHLASMACLANVRHLTQLTELFLGGNSGLTQQGLMLLTGLKRLQHLKVDRNAEVTDEVVENFWAAVRGHQT